MLTTLTPEQEALLPLYAKRWTEIGLSTEPANRPEAERGIAMIYEAAGLPAPQVVWFDSPMAMLLKRCEASALGETKWVPIWNRVRDHILEQAGTSLTGQGEIPSSPRSPATRNSVQSWLKFLTEVQGKVWKLAKMQVQGQVTAEVRKRVRVQVKAPVWLEVWEQFGYLITIPDQSEEQFEQFRTTYRDAYYRCAWGQRDAFWLSFYAFFQDGCGLTATNPLRGITLLSENAGWYLPYRHVCYVSERPSVLKQDERGRLHCEDGPALAYSDGRVYAIHGVRVPEQVILHPETITVAQIENQLNAEVRRVMVDRYGPDRYLVDSGAQLIHQDDYGSLFRKDQDHDEFLVMVDEPLLMIKVVNSTPEPYPGPNGETPYFKDYWLRVPPDTKTAHEGVAWTFGLTPETYHPSLQT